MRSARNGDATLSGLLPTVRDLFPGFQSKPWAGISEHLRRKNLLRKNKNLRTCDAESAELAQRGVNMPTHVNQITGKIIGAAIEVHRRLGPGLLESAYQECLARELLLRRIRFERQKPLPLEYKGIRLECGYRIDLLVEGSS